MNEILIGKAASEGVVSTVLTDRANEPFAFPEKRTGPRICKSPKNRRQAASPKDRDSRITRLIFARFSGSTACVGFSLRQERSVTIVYLVPFAQIFGTARTRELRQLWRQYWQQTCGDQLHTGEIR